MSVEFPEGQAGRETFAQVGCGKGVDLSSTPAVGVAASFSLAADATRVRPYPRIHEDDLCVRLSGLEAECEPLTTAPGRPGTTSHGRTQTARSVTV
jgi:hypothetical protein